jgi:DNA transposition AAA+ family ATPase
VPNAVLDALCAALGLDVRIKDGARRMQVAIEKRLRGTRGLVIVDEAQLLSFSSLETCRAQADATGIGFVFMGAHGLSIKIGGRRQIGTTAQFVSRLAMRVKIEAPHASDAPGLLDGWEVDDADARRALLPLAARPGAFRNIVMVIELATLAATVAGEELGAKHFTAALKELDGD